MATASVVQCVDSPAAQYADSPQQRSSVYEIVTQRILAELEKGEVPWRKPWRILPPANLVSEQATAANSAAYLKTRIARLKSDSRLVVQAASAAQKAADCIREEFGQDSPASA